MKEITARLESARIYRGISGIFLVGKVHEDKHRRWKDGYHIHTSWIVEELGEDTFLSQSGNTYKVSSWLTDSHVQ